MEENSSEDIVGANDYIVFGFNFFQYGCKRIIV